MVRKRKLYERLDQLEHGLTVLLLAELENIALGKFPWIFDSPATNPILNTWIWKKEQYALLLKQVSEIESLRQKLGEPKK